MKTSWKRLGSGLLLLVALTTMGLTGCQTTVGGQTLPSGYYLRDDVQFFPAGPEFLLYNTERAYSQRQQQDDSDDDAN
ncbi:MAG: hypothetical protein CMJ65_14695 [Planctomycetaceae bacterium]|jgi:hypothetical protein|nr:hypothetical protein [Planctomycetaceae bacterium]MDP7275959.1 hypothetical protein [Planctomycetaceae bacterium]